MAKFLGFHTLFVMIVGAVASSYMGYYALTSSDATHQQRSFAAWLAILGPASLWRYYKKYWRQDDPQQV